MPTTDLAIAVNRFGLGARGSEALPAEPRAWLAAQLLRFDPRPPPLAELPDTAEMLAAWREYKEDRQRRRAKLRRPSGGEIPPEDAADGGDLSRHDVGDIYREAAAARLALAAQTETPFVERMVQFWANHFAISVDKPGLSFLAGPFEAEAIRPHVCGRFEDMLIAVEHHPAMLFYLDQASSIGPNSRAGERRSAKGAGKAGLNENLGREILELHTLGIRTGYTQADVTELARALTGRLVPGVVGGDRPDRFGYSFNERAHEPGQRTILGKTYPEGGEEQAIAILRDLAAHPATARHIGGKLARAVVADEPPAGLVARLEQAFLETGGDLPAVYRALIDAPESWDPVPRKFRTPYEWTVASLRALDAAQLRPASAVGVLTQTGQPLWRPRSPAGYDLAAATWVAPDTLFRRIEAAARFASQAGKADALALARKLHPGTLSPSTERILAGAESPAEGIALLLASPEAMWR